MSIDLEKFIRSDYNTLINVVSSSEDSVLFKRLNQRQNIIESTQIQDWKYSDPAYTGPRYDGAKSTSKNYNFYTEGDTSFGKNASIDIITTKFAWATPTTENSLNFFDTTTLTIKYLIDVTGSLTELSSKNNNWYEVQNIFKKGNFLNISLLDKNNPTNQSGLEGNKIIYESGYRYSPIIYRESNETLKFLYNTPKETTNTKLGIKVVNTSTFIFETVGNTDTNLTDVSDPWTYFKIDGVDQPGNPFSFNRSSLSQWPYNTSSPINTVGPYITRTGRSFYNSQLSISFSADNPNNIGGGKYYYTLDRFTPNKSGSVDGGFFTPDNIGAMKVNLSGGQWYTYYEAPRTSDYIVNVNVPIKVSFKRNPDSGPSVVRVVGIIEKQSIGSSNWQYVMETNLEYTNIPETYTNEDIGIDSRNSSIYMDGEIIQRGNTFIQANCVIKSQRVRDLQQGEKLRLKLYFVEVMNFFRRSESVYFEISSGDTSKSFFEVYDEISSQITLDFDQDVIGTSTTYAMFSSYNENTIEFDTTSSLLYGNSIFFAPTASDSFKIPDYYSGVEYEFDFQPGDVIRFGTYFSVNPEIYYVESVSLPVIQTINNIETVVTPLRITLDKKINSSKVNSRSFAFFKRRKDETVVLIKYKKPKGVSSNYLVIPYNLDKEIEKNTSNILNNLKDTLSTKLFNS